MKLLILFTILSTAQAIVYLDSKNFKEMTEGKKAFVAFKAPWCGHCKKLKKEWEKLADNTDIVVGEVDCTKEEALCTEYGVRGYPTIKYSNGYGWQKYEKGRDYPALKTFVDDNMGDTCFDDKSLCTEDELDKIDLIMELTTEDVDQQLLDYEREIKRVEQSFNDQVAELEKQYKLMTKAKNKKVEEVQNELMFLKYVSKNYFP